jgi:hypothetical protein
LILFWMQNGGGSDWLRQSVLAAELGIGIILLRLARFQPKPNSI